MDIKTLVPFTQWLDNFGGGKCSINTREWHSNAVVNLYIVYSGFKKELCDMSKCQRDIVHHSR